MSDKNKKEQEVPAQNPKDTTKISADLDIVKLVSKIHNEAKIKDKKDKQ